MTAVWISPMSMLITLENSMMIRWLEQSEKSVTRRQAEWIELKTRHRVAWSQLKVVTGNSLKAGAWYMYLYRDVVRHSLSDFSQRNTRSNQSVAPHCSDVMLGVMASQITRFTIVYSTVYSGADQRNHQSPASLAFVREFTGERWIPHTNGQ